MSNRIVQVMLIDHNLVPASAELRVQIIPEYCDSKTQLRGRCMGPRCRFAATIEVAYPLRPLDALSARILIPEASLWEPLSPHLYLGRLELWQDEQRVDTVEVRHGLRRLQWTSEGLKLNGKKLPLSSRAVSSLDESEALMLRQAGVNLLIVDNPDSSRAIYRLADEFGFLVASERSRSRSPLEAPPPSDLGELSGVVLQTLS